MTPEHEPGASESVEREVRAEHRRLDALFEDARDAFRAGEALDAARESFASLCDALETHFDQEDRLYYPPIWALRPESKPLLAAAVAAHEDLRARLRQIAALLEEGELAGAEGAFEELAAAFARHEQQEEQALAALDRELAPPR